MPNFAERLVLTACFVEKEMKMKKGIFFPILSLLIIQGGFSQGLTPEEWGLKAFKIEHETLGDIHYYVTIKDIDQKKPLLFMYSGTSGLPTMLVVRSGEKSLQLGTVPPDQLHSFSTEFHVVFMAKAGTPFCDTVEVEKIDPMKNLEEYRPSDEYVQKAGMEWEMQASKLVIDDLLNRLSFDKNKIVAMGMSEGGLLVTRLASEDSRITHVVSVISTGLNQFFSSIINRRIDAATGALTHGEAQKEVESLFAIYKDVYANPESTEKWYYGHPYRRWGSFCNFIPVDHLVKLDIPILLVNGTADRSSPILQSDYIMLEFIRLGKTNLTYHVVPGMGHSLHGVIVEDGKEKRVSHSTDVFKYIKDWIQSKSR
jgi:esterase/lipase